MEFFCVHSFFKITDFVELLCGVFCVLFCHPDPSRSRPDASGSGKGPQVARQSISLQFCHPEERRTTQGARQSNSTKYFTPALSSRGTRDHTRGSPKQFDKVFHSCFVIPRNEGPHKGLDKGIRQSISLLLCHPEERRTTQGARQSNSPKYFTPALSSRGTRDHTRSSTKQFAKVFHSSFVILRNEGPHKGVDKAIRQSISLQLCHPEERRTTQGARQSNSPKYFTPALSSRGTRDHTRSSTKIGTQEVRQNGAEITLRSCLCGPSFLRMTYIVFSLTNHFAELLVWSFVPQDDIHCVI
ncbi:hypothetical protein JOD96_003821 [Flavobacterium sp. 1355]|nr:hypothetical protein [Flavobacterium sp. 1355]